MPREARQRSASGVYHIMSRGNSQMEIFHDDADNLTFLKFLSEAVDDDFQVIAYCLMGNHFHLLVITNKEKDDVLESKMKSILIRYVEYYNRRYCRVGILFQGRFKSQPVETVSYFCRVVRYIHYNPVAAEICADMQDYPWSSYREYFCQNDDSKTKYFSVNKDYALMLHDLDWFRMWHERREDNAAGFVDVDTTIHSSGCGTDSLLDGRFSYLYKFKISTLASKDEATQRKYIRRICIEEGFAPKQVSRMTGIPKGLVDRYLL